MRRLWQRIVRFLAQPHGDAKSFEREVEAAGVTGRVDGGMRTIPAAKIVGSVGRAQNLRSDFFYRSRRAMTARFVSIGKAMEAGKLLPPIEVYRAKLSRRQGEREVENTEYYVVDGHHRVAMAKKLGQDYLDAHVVDYRVAAPQRPAGDDSVPDDSAAAGTAETATPATRGEPHDPSGGPAGPDGAPTASRPQRE
jgi:hypothetical protein